MYSVPIVAPYLLPPLLDQRGIILRGAGKGRVISPDFHGCGCRADLECCLEVCKTTSKDQDILFRLRRALSGCQVLRIHLAREEAAMSADACQLAHDKRLVTLAALGPLSSIARGLIICTSRNKCQSHSPYLRQGAMEDDFRHILGLLDQVIQTAFKVRRGGSDAPHYVSTLIMTSINIRP